MTKPKRLAWIMAALVSAACRDSHPAPPAADSCQRWATDVCTRAGEDSEACEGVKTSIELLTADTCAAALARPERLNERLASRTRACSDLRERLCAELGPRTRACKTATEQTAKFDADRCLAMLRSYPEVRSKLAAAHDPLRLSSEDAAKLLTADRPSRGPAGAKLQLVEFLDFENQYSLSGAKTLHELEAKYGDQLRVVVRMYPLDESPHGRLAAEAAFAAHAQGKFWQMHDALLAHRSALDRAALGRYAGELGLDLKAFESALDRHTYARDVDADLKLAKELQITAMPTMFLNGERMLNAADPQLLIDAAEEILSR